MAKTSTLQFGLPPRADLLPAAERQQRALTQWRDRWIRAVLIALIAMAVLVAGQFFLRMNASNGLDEVRSTEAELNAKIASHSQVGPMVTERDMLYADREKAMSADMDWFAPYSMLTRALPKGAQLISFDAVVGGEYTGKDDSIGLKAIVTVQSAKPIDQATILGSFAKIPRVLDVDMLGLQETEDQYNYRVFVLFSQKLYSNHFLLTGPGKTL
jgi:hypothetical protein